MKLLRKLLIVVFVASALICASIGQVQAESSQELLKEQIEYYARNIDINDISKEDILKAYDEITKQYSNEEIANIIEENSEEMQEQGISKEAISAGANFIRTTDEKSIRKIIEDDLDIEDIKEKIEQGYTSNELVTSVITETPNEKKVEIFVKVLLANKIVKTVLRILVILFIYGTILRWIIYTKAGKPGWAAIIPLYRQIVMYQVCGLSPFLMLLWLIPILGWFAMAVVAIMKRFCLAKEFGRGALFGFGLLFFPTIFQSIIAFNSNIQKESE